MNLAEFIKQHKFPTETVEKSLLAILTNGCNKSIRRKIHNVIKNKFFTLISDSSFPWNRFSILNDFVSYIPKDAIKSNAELKAIREKILKIYGD
jgi:hypothetical protein